MKTVTDVRDDLIRFVCADLVGPAHGLEESLEDPPRIRYAAGVLLPQESTRNESDEVSGVEGDTEAQGEKVEAIDPEASHISTSDTTANLPSDSEYDDPVTLANSYRPSALGLSFTVDSTSSRLVISVRAATYATEREPLDGGRVRTKWRRQPLELESVSLQVAQVFEKKKVGLAEGLILHSIQRPRGDGTVLVTITLYNSTMQHQKEARTFFQTGFEVRGENGTACFPEYRTQETLPHDPEDTALAMLYRDRQVFAVGHGCSADWETPEKDKTSRVSTEVLPQVVVPPIVPLEGDERHLSMQFLSGGSEDPRNDIPAELRRFCDGYESWVDSRQMELEVLDEKFRAIGKRHVALCRLALTRMLKGVDLLSRDDVTFEAFTLVNQVMLRQQYHAQLVRRLKDPWVPLPQKADYQSDWSTRRGYWRAFQLAFLLITLPGVVSDDDVVRVEDDDVSSRDIVDLIWFPTGGGKTEAYLALAAFVILTSRMKETGRDGCRVLMRYTLRVLTSQQFERAASMICACELVRRANPTRFGDTPISIGLWVGMSLTPNDEADALRHLGRLERNRPNAKNPFQLLSCPWCGTELNNPEKLGYAEYRRKHVFVCPTATEDECPFSTLGEHLPIKVVDESIYADPPSLIIGTVDKFAMLAWRGQAGRILRTGAGPDLIIQDELHLITGPLGSMMGLYEGAIDFLCGREGRRPKIVASTATIRRAEAQCRALYDRPMLQFPPPGLTASDSYFAREDRSAAGRLYVGFLPTASSSPLTAQIRSVVALQQGAVHVTGEDTADELVDPYWTLIQYFGSLKELGRAATFTTADIPEFLPTMHRRYGITDSDRRWMRTAEELTSRKNEEEIPKILKRLQVPYRKDADWDDQALDTVLATNIISVGVDIARLGLMMIVTQPKGTSEYIQASSRIGRSSGAPGLVFTLYSAGRPRDRSHYEQFKAYHEAFYRFVEPTSVTPFAPPAMERALHAVLVIGGRHVAGWDRPSDFEVDDPNFVEFLQFIKDRARRVDPEHVPELNDFIDHILDEWETRRPERWGDLSGERAEPMLIRVAGTDASESDQYSWETPTSMRNVDVECGAEVVARYLTTSGGEQ